MLTHAHGRIIWRPLALAALACLAQACVTSPSNGQLIPDLSAPVTVAGFYNQPNAPLTIEVSNPATGAWEVLSTTTSETTPVFTAGTWQNSPPLYFYSTTVQVSDPAHPQTFQRWSGSTPRVATLRVRSGDFPLYTGQEPSVSCVINNASQPGDFYTTAYNCGYQQTTVCIHALDPEPLTNTGVRWRLTFASPGFQQIQVVRNHDTSLAFFALGVDGRMYYAQQNGANGAWGGLIDLGGEGLRDFAVAKNQDGRLELFVIGSDEAIYHRWQAWHSSVDWYGWYSSVAGVFAIWPRPRIPTARWCSSSWARTATSTAASRPRRTAAGVPGRP